MIVEGQFKFTGIGATQQDLTATADSTNVYDAGSAKLLFGGFSQNPPYLHIEIEWTAGASSPTITADFVGSDEATLDTNVIIASTGPITLADDGTAFAAGHVWAYRDLALRGQVVAKRYYGVIWTVSGTGANFSVKAAIVHTPQRHDAYQKAAVP